MRNGVEWNHLNGCFSLASSPKARANVMFLWFGFLLESLQRKKRSTHVFIANMMLCGLWNKDRASCITEGTLIETGVYAQGLQLQEPQITDRLGILPKLIHLTSCLWQKNPAFRENSLCSLIWPNFDLFESADWPLKSSTNFRIWWKICFYLWSAQAAYSKASQECSFRCKFELASPKQLVWHTRNSCNL